MTTAVLTHSDCLQHVNPPGHPECGERLTAVLSALADAEFTSLVRADAPLGTDDQVLLAHPPAYLAAIKAASPTQGWHAIDGDTTMSPGTLDAALRGVGAIVQAVDMVMTGAVTNAFCATRPPGHHAETQTAMGFCFFGNVVIGARHALSHHGLSRVAIVDFDVHHGNGTQDLVWDDARILFASTHQMPLYPGSGAANETGAHGNVVNVPLRPNTDGAVFRQLFETEVLPALARHKPEMIFISAGFDAHRDDPLANLNLVEADFVWATRKLCDFADEHCQGRVVSTLEGGYDLQALAASVAAHVTVLMEQD
jgi:acetoin utilization deacetylase AcuC-like enzyme